MRAHRDSRLRHPGGRAAGANQRPGIGGEKRGRTPSARASPRCLGHGLAKKYGLIYKIECV